MTDDKKSEFRIRIWHGRDGRDGEPDEVVTVEEDEPHLWQDDPWYDSGPIGFDIHPEDGPATLYIRTNDSVRAPHPSDTTEWGRAIERGLSYPEDHDYPPFGCEVWGRVLFTVEADDD